LVGRARCRSVSSKVNKITRWERNMEARVEKEKDKKEKKKGPKISSQKRLTAVQCWLTVGWRAGWKNAAPSYGQNGQLVVGAGSLCGPPSLTNWLADGLTDWVQATFRLALPMSPHESWPFFFWSPKPHHYTYLSLYLQFPSSFISSLCSQVTPPSI